MNRRWSPRLGWVILALALLLYPLLFQAGLISRFWVLTLGAQPLFLGTIALSLIFLAGYGGMVSLAQAALAGVAGYTVALLTVPVLPKQIVIFGEAGVGPAFPAVAAVAVALLLATLVGLLFGLIAVRSHGIYFLMLTAALGVAFFYLANQNYDTFGGHGGIPNVVSPFGFPNQNPLPFYYLTLACAAALYAGVKYIARSPFGLALQGIRDNPRRMRALGYWVGLHRVVAFGLSGFVAGVGGILATWYRGNISPGSIDVTRTIDMLIVAVVGGLRFPAGAFVGALLFVLLDSFSSSIPQLGPFNPRERFNTLIGLTFLLVVLFSPDGLIGIARRLATGGPRRRAAGPVEARGRTEVSTPAGAEVTPSRVADPASER